MWESGSYAPPRWRLANHLGRDHAPSQESTALLMPHWEGVRLTKDRVNIVTMTFDLTLRLCAIGFFYLATLVIIPQLMESRSKPPGFVPGRGCNQLWVVAEPGKDQRSAPLADLFF